MFTITIVWLLLFIVATDVVSLPTMISKTFNEYNKNKMYVAKKFAKHRWGFTTKPFRRQCAIRFSPEHGLLRARVCNLYRVQSNFECKLSPIRWNPPTYIMIKTYRENMRRYATTTMMIIDNRRRNTKTQRDLNDEIRLFYNDVTCSVLIRRRRRFHFVRVLWAPPTYQIWSTNTNRNYF